MRRIFWVFMMIHAAAFAQQEHQPDAAHIRLKLRKLNVLASVLYVAAHPDDENTQVITTESNSRLAETAYLSMTRGDGGQNLIGPEIRDLLGLIRTQELLAARKIDGGKQFFTRANDFGFSKSADEAFRLWNKQEILSDVVKVFRKFQPDVIITRFPPDQRAGHGHHTASAILAQEAFDEAAKPELFPEQVKEFGTWQATRLFTNTGRWWNTTINENTPGITVLNVGGYSPLLGTSFTEIAANSRSQHKSQGYGSRGERGDELEFFEFVKGVQGGKDIFDGVNTTWGRVKNAQKVQALVDEAIAKFNDEDPAALVPMLWQIRKEIATLEPGVWKARKLIEVDQLIKDCLGLFVEVTADHYWSSPGQQVTASVELVNRSNASIVVQKIQCNDLTLDSTLATALKNNVSLKFKTTRAIIATKKYSDPYWLREPHSVGLFTVHDPELIGKPQNDPAIEITFQLEIDGNPFTVKEPLQYKWEDPVRAELSRPFEIVPPVFINLSDPVMVFSDDQPREVRVKIKSATAGGISGNVKLRLPPQWRSQPESIPVELKSRDAEDTKVFQVFPAKTEINSSLLAVVEIGGKEYDQSIRTIVYDHIPTQTLLPKASAKVARINLKREGKLIGYIRGAGDEIPAALRTMGYEVWEMKDDEVNAASLKRVDAVVLGVRAFNTNKRMPYMITDLLDYVKTGGTLVVQYNTETDINKFSPYPLTLSRERVTEEDDQVRFLAPDHPVLNTPNKITAKDFEGWVQERGLNFPNKWDPQFQPILSMNDKGEAGKDGSLLVAKYGEGHYIYTGLSFFRELPEGVPGAYKLFANLVSLGKAKKPENVKVKTKAR